MIRMRFGQIGGVLVVGGSVACLIAITIIVAGDNAGNELYRLAGTILPAAVALISLGALVLGLPGPKPLGGRSIRIGLGMLGAGFLCFMAANVVPAPDGRNNLQSWPHIIGLFGGALVMAVGVLVTGLALVRSPGPLRVAGLLLVAGVLLLPCAAILSSMAIEGQPFPIGGALEALGFAGVCLGVAGIGALAIAGDRSLGGDRMT
jgi:hypothetical protein